MTKRSEKRQRQERINAAQVSVEIANQKLDQVRRYRNKGNIPMALRILSDAVLEAQWTEVILRKVEK